MEKFPDLPDERVAACAAALRNVSLVLISLVGVTETRQLLFAESLSVAQIELTADQIAARLRELANRVENGELTPRMQ
jgi:hypothetical protein